MRSLKKYLRKQLDIANKEVLIPWQLRGKQKIFCVGMNKTGTTSLMELFKGLGFVVGNQREAENLLPFYKSRNFEPIIDYCKKYQVFQDFPFSYPETYRQLDKAFPGSKFILSVRDSPEQWYHSVTRFHSKSFGNGKLPAIEDLKSAKYVWDGWVYEAMQCVFHTPLDEPYHKDTLIGHYLNYNKEVGDYFRDRGNDFIKINLANPQDFPLLIKFLKIETTLLQFPWMNKTEVKALDE